MAGLEQVDHKPLHPLSVHLGQAAMAMAGAYGNSLGWGIAS